MKEVRLLHFKGCPNVEQARANIRAALAHLGLAVKWEETDIQAQSCPEKWKGFPSPTVLVSGAEVMSGAAAQPGESSCRIGGAPSVEQICSALEERPALASFAALPAAAAGFLPATFCPACFPALGGLLGAVGLGAFAERLLAPLTIVLLLVALAGLGYQARRSRDYRPLVIGAAGAAAMYGGQIAFRCAPVKWLGIALLIAASFWNVFPRLKRDGESCPLCVGGR